MTPELLALKQHTTDRMVSYMKFGAADDEKDPDYDPTFDAGYTQKHIDGCSKIIDDYFAALKVIPALKSEECIAKAVKSAVLKLNHLNEECDGNLIETDQREELCELILSAAKQVGLESNEDLTEEWREW